MFGAVCFLAGLAGVFVAAGWAGARAVSEGVDAKGRWGAVRARTGPVGDGAFRSASLHDERSRPVPIVVWLSGVSGAAWGILSAMIVAPASTVLSMFAAVRHGAHWEGLAVVALVAAGLSFVSGYFVFAASFGVLRCERGVGPRAARTGATALVQNALPILLFATLAGPTDELTLTAVALYSFGAFHGALLWAAGGRVDEIQGEMSPLERGSLPEPEMVSEP